MAIADIPRYTTDPRGRLTGDAHEDLSADTLRRIAELRALPENWDGYRSPPIADAAIGGALHVLQEAQARVRVEPYIGPVTGGGIQVEWHFPHRELELEVLPNGTIGYITIEDGEYSEDEAIASYWDDELLHLIDWLSTSAISPC